MTPEQLEQQSRDAVIAYLQDSSVKLEYRAKDEEDWFKNTNNDFDLDYYYFRIAQPKPWYRVALMNYGLILLSSTDSAYEGDVANCSRFIKWITERIEYSNEDKQSTKD